MEDTHRLRIQENIKALIEGVDLNRLYPLLIREGIIFPDDVESLQTEFPSKSPQACEFYMRYMKRGPTAFDTLTKSLRSLGYNKEAQILETDPVNGIASNGSSGEQQEPLSGRETGAGFIDIHSAAPLNAELNANPAGEFMYLDVRVKPAEICDNGQTKNIYRMTSKPRGFALIVNNINFKNNGFPYRRGAEVDSVNMRSLLEQLGFDVTVLHDLEKNDFYMALENFKEKFTAKAVDACIVSIMTHGSGENEIEMCDAVNAKVNIWDDVVTKFNNRNCPALKKKPKIFFIQCCRGELSDYGIPHTESDSSSFSNDDPKQTDAGNSTKVGQKYSGPEPEFLDILLCYATIPRYVANRETVTGTWYIGAICEVFMKRAHNTELKKLLDKVGRRMERKKADAETLQTPSYKSVGFNRDLYFNPGLYEDTSRFPD